MRLREALAAAAERFAAVSDTPRLDAELLMAHALGLSREALLLGPLDAPVPEAFAALAARRSGGEPVAYLTGTRDFWTLTFAVGPGVLIPRPDSETLIEAAIGHFAGRAPRTILDLGTGPGTLLLAALSQWPEARGMGIDASEVALGYARRNAHAAAMEGRAELRVGDWAAGVAERFDLVLCNPPYVAEAGEVADAVRAFEPAEALFAGADGLDAYRVLAPQIARLIARGGCACVEIGHSQAARAGALFRAEGLKVAVRKDLAGRDRCLLLTQ